MRKKGKLFLISVTVILENGLAVTIEQPARKVADKQRELVHMALMATCAEESPVHEIRTYRTAMPV